MAQKIDSLEQVIRLSAPGDTARIDAMNTLSRDLTLIDPVRSAKLASEALQTSLQTGYKKGQAYGYRILSSIFFNNENNIIAEEYWLRAMKLFSEAGDSAGIANCYITKGNRMRRYRRSGEELEYQLKAFQVFSRLQIRERIAVSAHNLGETYQLRGQDSLARELTLLAIRLNDSVGNISVLSNCYKVLGKLEMASGNTQKALTAFRQVLALSDRLGVNSQKEATVESLLNLAKLYAGTGHADLQLEYLQRAATFSRENLMANYLDTAYTALIEYYGGNRQAVTAYTREYRERVQEVAMGQIKARAELEKYGVEVYHLLEKEMRKLEKNNLEIVHRIRSKNRWLAMVVAAALVLSGFLLLLLKLLRERKKTATAMKQQAEQLQLLTARLQNIREEERTRLAWEIHEGMGQRLIVLKMDMAFLKNQESAIQEPAAAKISEAESILDELLGQVRQIATSLRPSVLDDLGLAVAMHWQLAEFEKIYQVSTHLEDRLGDRDIPREIRTGLFRVFQECLSNIGWHAHARKVEAGLYWKNGHVFMQIQDDGTGFSPEALESDRSLGFLDMQERCRMIGGKFMLKSAPGKGTTITVQVPLPAKTA